MIVIVIILYLYAAFLLWNWRGVLRGSINNSETKVEPVSIIIPFHNEEANLPALWSSLEKLYGLSDKVEIVFVNDHSTDSGVFLLNDLILTGSVNCSIKVINGVERGKKSCIQLGVEFAQNRLILITDADVKVHRNWLIEMGRSLQHNDLVLGSVINIDHSISLLSLVQDIEALMLEGIKTGSANNSYPLLASGANLGFRKDKFLKSNPYSDNLHIPSGDDMFLLAIARNENWRIINNSNAPNETAGAKSVKSSVKQHRRWAGKTTKLKNNALTLFGVLTLLAHLSFIIGIIWLIKDYNNILALSLIIKFLVEFLFLFTRAIIFKRLKFLIFTPIMSICYPFYLMIVIIGLNKNKTNW